jgi:hypothetical protein
VNKLDEIDDRLDAVGLIVSLIIQAAVSHQHELPRLSPGLVLEDPPEFEPV